MSESRGATGNTPSSSGSVAIVANQTIAGDALRDAVERRIRAGQRDFVLLVPVPSFASRSFASPAAVEVGIPMVTTEEVDYDRQLGEQRLEFGTDWLEGLGATATGEVTLTADTPDRVRDLVEAGAVVEVIVSTLPSRLSKWLRQDLPHRIERKVDVPVEVVTPADE